MNEPDLSLASRLARAIALSGPISVAHFMATANAAYYGSRDPLGGAGDFITAPEISQIFGEMIGLWSADLVMRREPPAAPAPGRIVAALSTPHYVELGPGRGTLALDALRVMAQFGYAPREHFVETSAVLRSIQAERVSGAVFHDDVGTLPTDAPLIVIANEFFDALPVQQVIKSADGWQQRQVACRDTLFLPIAGKRVLDEVIPAHLRAAAPGSIIETSPASVAIIDVLAARLRRQGGALLIIDYGYEGPAIGDTLQALRGHEFANPFAALGEQDLTAHVDFGTLAAAGRRAGLRVSPLVTQGDWLTALGIHQRAENLAEGAPERRAGLQNDAARLTAPAQMGQLFKVMAMTAPDWPEPEGFGAGYSESE